MGLLAKGGGGGMDDQFKQVTISGEPLVCPDCRTEVPPWIGECPDCGIKVVTAGGLPSSGMPVPAHLLDGLDAAEAEEGDADGAVDEDANDAEDDDLDWPA